MKRKKKHGFTAEFTKQPRQSTNDLREKKKERNLNKQ